MILSLSIRIKDLHDLKQRHSVKINFNYILVSYFKEDQGFEYDKISDSFLEIKGFDQ